MAELTFQGETFALEDSYPAMLAADLSADLVDLGGVNLVALRAMLKSLIVPKDWQRFHDLCVSSRADTSGLLKAMEDAVEAVSERPTEQPSDSSDGLESAPESSAADSASRVVGRLEGRGRPDLALQVVRTQEFLAQQTA